MREIEALDGLYKEIVLDHYHSPRNADRLESPDAEGEAINPFCGDEVRVQLGTTGETISAISVCGVGCSISQSSASLMGEAVKGKTLEDAKTVLQAFRDLMMKGNPSDTTPLGDLEALSGVRAYPVRIKCALLGWTALEDALKAASS